MPQVNRKATKENTKAVTAEMIAELKAHGPLALIQRIDSWLLKSLTAELRDDAGLKVDAEIDMHTARLALAGLWDAARRGADSSTSLGANLINQYRVKALREVADDPRVLNKVRQEFIANKGNSAGVFDD